jgi:hypothetical protein
MITVFRGDDLDLTLSFKTVTGAAIDLTGCTLFATVKSSIEDPDTSAALTPTVTISTPETAGICTVTATATQMSALRGQYILDVQLKTAAGKIRTPFKSDFYVDEDVTIRVV